jgi:hypothetical protein
MPLDFIDHVASGIGHLDSGDWLTPTTVHGITDIDFVTLRSAPRRELFRRVEQFRSIALAAPNVDPARTADARAALTAIWEILLPYRRPRESETVRTVLLQAWEDEHVRDWIPTFDYQLAADSTGDPAVRIWLVLEDGVPIDDPETRARLRRLERLFHARLQEAAVERWPYVGVRTRSEVGALVAGASA